MYLFIKFYVISINMSISALQITLCSTIFKPDTDRIESLTSKERGSRAEVSVVKLDIVGPFLPSTQTPWRPPTLIVQHCSPVVVLSDLHTQHSAFRAHWGKTTKQSVGCVSLTMTSKTVRHTACVHTLLNISDKRYQILIKIQNI